MTRGRAARSARYGQACQSCAKAKARCIVRSDGDGCERCHRLTKECRAPEPLSRRRPTDSNHESHGRIALLEDRLQGIVSLLQARSLHSIDDSRPHPEMPVDGSQYASTTPPTSPSVTVETALAEGADTDIDLDVIVESEVDNPDATPTPVLSARISAQLDFLSARCLETFRSNMLPYFPFFQLAPNLTVDELRSRRPLLLQAIVCVAWPIPREKRARATEVKRAFSEAAFLERQQDNQPIVMDSMVDLLLGIMTYITWGWDYVHTRGSLSRLMMVCVSLIGEMRLDRPTPKEPHTNNLLTPVVRMRDNETELRPSAERQRAVLGCFVLSSIVSGYFKDMDTLKWTPKLEETLVAIDANRESPTDTDLVLQVRLQLLSIKAIELRDLLREQPNQLQPPVSAHKIFSDAEALLSQLQELRRASYWSSQHQQQIHLAHTYYVELLILETIRSSTAIISRLDGPSISGSGPNDAHGSATQDQPSQGYSDLSYMWQSVLAINACTSGLLSLPSDFRGISFLQWEQLAGCIVILSHLEGMEDPRINRAHARAVVDLPVLLDRIVERLSQTATDIGEDESSGVFTQLASGIRAFRASIQTSLVETNQSGPSVVSGCGGSNANSYQQGYFMNHKFWMEQFFVG